MKPKHKTDEVNICIPSKAPTYPRRVSKNWREEERIDTFRGTSITDKETNFHIKPNLDNG